MSGVTTNYYMFGRQYGDDINLAGGGRIVTQFSFLYFGNIPTNLISPGEWRIRFYKNDGALENSTIATSQKPNSLIWDSGLHPVLPGYQMTTLAVPQVTVPDRFTWTVEFFNLPQDSNNGAGLVLANPPTIGAKLPGKASTVIGSYTDFWMLEEADILDSWTLQVFSTNPNVGPQGNFFAQVVTVANPNKAPSWISAALNRRVSEGSTLLFQLKATDSDLPAQPLTYRLISGPTGLTVSTNGLLSWNPTEEQGPSTNRVRVDVHDGVEATSQEFNIVVQERNLPPVWTATSTRRVSEGLKLSFQLKATDSDLPAQPLTYRLISGPTGLTVSTNGLLSWNPTEEQGPSTNRVRVDVHDGVEATSQEFNIVVQERNLSPVWTATGTRRVSEGLRLSFQLKATDSDLPAQPLTYHLISGPAGLTVSTNGLLTWRPTENQGPSTNRVRVDVSDSLTTVAQDFEIIVRDSEPTSAVATLEISSNPSGTWNLRLRAASGARYQIEQSTSLGGTWTQLPGADAVVGKSLSEAVTIPLPGNPATNLFLRARRL